MDLWTIIGGLALIIGIVAGIVQVLDYLEKRRALGMRREVEETQALVARLEGKRSTASKG